MHERYMMRVTGLGTVQALFLPSACNDEEARSDLRICQRCDPRITVLALYRIETLNLDAPDIQRDAPASIYLETGIPDKDAGHVVNKFFTRRTDSDAKEVARERAWHENKLYRCEEIALT